PAFGTFAKRFLPAEIDRCLPIALSEIEFRFELVRQPNQAGERLAHLAAKTLQRSDDSLGDQFFNLADLELAARSDLPEREITVLALELFIVFLNPPAALRTRHLQGCEIPRHSVAFVAL